MTEALFAAIADTFPVSEVEHGDIGKFKVKGMNFVTRNFWAEGLGSVSIMEAKGMMGLMKMTTFIVNPFLLDAPLISYDRIKAIGNDTVYLEVFDTTLSDAFDNKVMEGIEREYKELPDHDLGTHWYDYMRVGTPICKKGKKKDSDSFDLMSEAYFTAYIEACKKAPLCDEDEKRKKAASYSEGLLINGGPATDPVKAELGDEKASLFFRKVLFATEK